MTGDDLSPSGAAEGEAAGYLIVRSEVPSDLPYQEYRQYLRRDFFFCCAYCTVSEAEAGGVRFTVDHYEPKSLRPDLKDRYDNLMYCCDICNTRKGTRSPPEEARAAGYRFFRPDNDNFIEHYEPKGIRLEAKTATADYTINALDLNRHGLMRIRQIRQRLGLLAEQVAEGVRGLRRLKLDQLPPQMRGRALRAIQNAEVMEGQISRAIDAVLEEEVRSVLLDEDKEAYERSLERVRALKHIESLFPENWRAKSASKRG